MLLRGGSRDLFPVVFSRSIGASYRLGNGRIIYHARVMDIQAVNKVDFESATPEIACEGEEAKGF